MHRLRVGTPDDVAEILPRTRALNEHEGIQISDAALEAALRRLLADRNLGGVWIIQENAVIVGYAIVAFSYDLEFGGRDAYLTELWIDESARGNGAGTAALSLLFDELQELDVRALHLQVRPENPALRLYERNGFSRSPRLLMTRRL